MAEIGGAGGRRWFELNLKEGYGVNIVLIITRRGAPTPCPVTIAAFGFGPSGAAGAGRGTDGQTGDGPTDLVGIRMVGIHVRKVMGGG